MPFEPEDPSQYTEREKDEVADKLYGPTRSGSGGAGLARWPRNSYGVRHVMPLEMPFGVCGRPSPSESHLTIGPLEIKTEVMIGA